MRRAARGDAAYAAQPHETAESKKNQRTPAKKKHKGLKIAVSLFLTVAVLLSAAGVYFAYSKVDVEAGAQPGSITVHSDREVNETVRLALKLEASDSGTVSNAPENVQSAIEILATKATYGIRVDDVEVVACYSEEDARWALNRILEDYKTEDMVTYNFVETVKIQSSDKSAVSREEALIALKKCAPYDYHVVTEKDTMASILKKYGMTEDELKQMNKGLSQVQKGLLLKVKGEGSWLNFTYTKTSTKDSAIAYTTQSVKDVNMYIGTSRVSQYGKNGVARTTYTTTYINGVETDVKEGETVTVTEPVNKIVRVGSRPRGNKVPGAPRLIWPLPGTIRITSYYGNRGTDYHTGLDMGAPAGTSIYAAAAGTVTRVQKWDGHTKTGMQSYGNMVEIDHGNGFTTRYAHMLTTPSVRVGQYVSQGTVIGKVGNTGNSFGNHLHLEFRVNGVHTDPLLYLP